MRSAFSLFWSWLFSSWQVTTSPEFDAFPMFSPDGKRLVFASNRNAAKPGETNIFIADWVE